jgi:hypothetical protein
MEFDSICVKKYPDASGCEIVKVFVKIMQKRRLPSVKINSRIPFNILCSEFSEDSKCVIP